MGSFLGDTWHGALLGGAAFPGFGIIPGAIAGAASHEMAGGGGGGGGGGSAPATSGGGGNKAPAANPIIGYIRSQNPGMSHHDAVRMFNHYQVAQAAPGLQEFISSQSNRPDPNTMQMFFANTVAPYLKQAGDQYAAGAASGTAAMQKVLSGSSPSPAIDVLKSFLPIQQANAQKMQGALQAATVTAPYYDALLQQLQQNVNSQSQAHADMQAQAAAASLGGSSGTSSFGAAVANGAKANAG